MTREEFTRQLPPLTNNPLPIKPPFLFNGMSARIFPLRASLSALQQLCNGYLNFIPPTAGRFRVSVPYVYLMVLDYGQVGEALARIGWFAQLEVFFSVPVEWYKLVNGSWVFHDWGVITPYIFVNDSFSVPLGRTVYGFPKVLAKVTSAPSLWIKNPLTPITVASIETAVFPKAYAGRRLENRVFLEVERQGPMSNLRVPFDLAGPATPWTIASNLAEALAGFGRDAMWMAQAMRVFPISPGTNPSFVPQMLGRLAPAFSPGGSGFVLNSLNLKQFRRADDPSRLSYQSLTNGRMIVTGFNAGGLLGEDRILLGDLSGGYTLKLHEHSSLPIARTLGLEVHHRSRGDEGDMAEIKPVSPLWININVLYQQGDNLAWRAQDGIWKDSGGLPIEPVHGAVADARGPEFNGAVTSAVEAIAGPFQFSGTTVRVLPLLAKREQLAAFLDEFVNGVLDSPIVREDGTPIDDRFRLAVWSRPSAKVNRGGAIGGDFAYVYLAVSSFENVTSKTNNVGDWAKYELSFMIPVEWQRLVNGTWQVEGVGVVPAVTLVDDSVAAISRFEVQGIEARTANFVRPESIWLSEEEAHVNRKQTLLRVDAEVWPAYGAGRKAKIQPLIEIGRGDADAGLGGEGASATSFEWAETLRVELGTKKGTKARFPDECKVARALALEVLGNHAPIAQYTLKQFRDVTDPVKACYQSLVRVPRVFKNVLDVCEIEETLVVRIHDYPSLKIVESLGIVAPTAEGRGRGVVHTAQAIRPFFIRATVDEPLAEELLSRAGTAPWTLSPAARHSILSDAPGAPAISANRLAEKRQDEGDPSKVYAVMYQARERNGVNDAEAISKDEARRALSLVDAQMVIESVLSREWGNADEDARWRRGRLTAMHDYDRVILGASSDLAALAESLSYKLANERDAARPGRPEKLSGDVERIIENLKKFTSEQSRMERHFNTVATWSIMRLAEARGEAPPPATSPSATDVWAEVDKLVASLQAIAALVVVGEPSPQNNLDNRVLSGKIRLDQLVSNLGAATAANQPLEGLVEHVWARLSDFRKAVEYARGYCEVQRDALLNKLSRTSQKPDFCIRRDSVGRDHDRLLPRTLSWDDDWYYGRSISANEVGGPSRRQP